MTIPTLMQNHQRKVYVTQLHKVYNEILQAGQMYLSERNAVNLKEAGLISQEACNDWVLHYFKTIQTCDGKILNPCFSDEYKYIDGSTANFIIEGTKYEADSFVLANGAAIRPLYDKNFSDGIFFMVDVNGQGGPNIIGRDAFFMALYKNIIIDTANLADATAIPPFTEEQRNTADKNWKPFGQILNDNWEMTY